MNFGIIISHCSIIMCHMVRNECTEFEPPEFEPFELGFSFTREAQILHRVCYRPL